MTEIKTSSNMVFFASIKDSIDALNLSDTLKVEYYEGVINYGLYGIAPSFSNPALNAIFIALKPNIDANNRKKQQAIKCSENGKKGGRPKKNISSLKSEDNGNEKTKTKSPRKTIDVDVDKDVDADADIDKDVCVCKSSGEAHTQTETPAETSEENSSVSTEASFAASDLAQRNLRFYRSLIPFVKTYGAETIQKFYDYWKEPTPDGLHMRFELERTWNLPGRLRRWKN